MSDRRWPSFAEVETMESTEAYDLYWHLPAPADAGQIELIRALGDQAWKMRQEEDAGKVRRTYLPMSKAESKPAPKPAPKPKFYPKPAPKEERSGGASFFLAGLKL